MNRSRVVVWRLPPWVLLLLGIPLLGLFFVSLLLAGAIAVAGVLLLPLVLPLFRRPGRPADDGTIELDRSDYRRLPDSTTHRRSHE